MLVYALGYWWAARSPGRHAHLVFLGLLGKVLGPLGFVWALWRGDLPASFGRIVAFNDVIWWPAFALYLRDAAAAAGGWRRFLGGTGHH